MPSNKKMCTFLPICSIFNLKTNTKTRFGNIGHYYITFNSLYCVVKKADKTEMCGN